MKNLVLLFSILCIFSACKDDDSMEEVPTLTPCEFVQDNSTMDGLIDESESNIMTSCFDNRITSEAELQSNTIGTWELIGHGEGLIPSISMPCASLIFTTDEVEYSFTNASVDTTLTMAWSVIQNSNAEELYHLEFEHKDLPATSLSIYCEQYMYINAAFVDGNMYLFEKLD